MATGMGLRRMGLSLPSGGIGVAIQVGRRGNPEAVIG